MAERQVKASRKDEKGNITALCNKDKGETWSPRSTKEVIADIEGGNHSYYVQLEKEKAKVEVVGSGSNKYLRTNKDTSTVNNLDNLPDC